MNQSNVTKLAKEMTQFCQRQAFDLATSPTKQMILMLVVVAIVGPQKGKPSFWQYPPTQEL